MNKIIIDLLRHGDIAGGQKLRGKTDDPLSKLGWQQMNAVIEGKTIPWQKIISSDLQRCQDFAIELSQQQSLSLQIDERLQEINFGQWDGQLLTELYDSDQADNLFQFMQLPLSITPPDGERYKDFKARVLTAWHDLLASLAKDKIEHCLVITHGGVIRAIISEVLGLSEGNLSRIEVPHACLSRITQYQNSPASLSFHNASL